MTLRERALYHQIHPLKLFTDVSTAAITARLLWRHQWAVAAVVAFVPSVIVSVLLIRGGRLDRYRQSSLGRYVARTMTRAMEAVRFAGVFLAWLGAWYHVGWLIPAGAIIILFGWLRGWVFGRGDRRPGEALEGGS